MKETILSLVSGLIGTLIGGLITFFTTRYSIQKSMEQALNLENRRKKDEDKAIKKSAISAITAELKENLASINEWKSFHSKFKFSDKAWEMYKPVIMSFNENVRNKILKVFVETSRHNTLIDYDFRAPFGNGNYDARIEEQVKKIETASRDALTELGVGKE